MAAGNPASPAASPCTGRFLTQEGKYITQPCFSPTAAPTALSAGLVSKLPASCTVKCSSFPKTAIKAGCFNIKFKFSPAKSAIRWKVGIYKSGTTCSPGPARISIRYACKVSHQIKKSTAGRIKPERSLRKDRFGNTTLPDFDRIYSSVSKTTNRERTERKAGFLDTIYARKTS